MASGVLLFRSRCPRLRGQGEGRKGSVRHFFIELKKQTVFFLCPFCVGKKKKVYRTLIFLLQLSEEKNWVCIVERRGYSLNCILFMILKATFFFWGASVLAKLNCRESIFIFSIFHREMNTCSGLPYKIWSLSWQAFSKQGLKGKRNNKTLSFAPKTGNLTVEIFVLTIIPEWKRCTQCCGNTETGGYFFKLENSWTVSWSK